MKLTNCEYDLETNFVEQCPPCRISRYERRIPIKIGHYVLYVTYQYEVRNCLQGFTGGDFVHAISLLPGEQQEVEVIQRSKYEQELHQQQSVESKFETEFMQTLRDVTSKSVDANFSSSGGLDLGILDFSTDISVSGHLDNTQFNEIVNKTASSVSNYYEISIDTKTEIENQYRSLRKISNPNLCRVVTYIFKQLSKKYSIDVVLVGIKFDLITKVPDIHSIPRPYYEEMHKLPISVRQPEVLTGVSASNGIGGLSAHKLMYNGASAAQLMANAQFAQQVLVPRELDLPKALTPSAFVAKVDAMKLSKADYDAVMKVFKAIVNDKNNQLQIVLSHTVYCVRTGSLVVEPKVSRCSICTCEKKCNCGCNQHDESESGEATEVSDKDCGCNK